MKIEEQVNNLFCVIVRGMKNESRARVRVLMNVWNGEAQHVQRSLAQRICFG
jgi:hypothetical protein